MLRDLARCGLTGTRGRHTDLRHRVNSAAPGGSTLSAVLARLGTTDYENLSRNGDTKVPSRPVAGGICARSGTTLGSGSVRLRYRKDDGTLGDIEKEVEDGDNITYNVTVYNIADSNVDSNSHVMAKRNAMSGNWYVDFAEC